MEPILIPGRQITDRELLLLRKNLVRVAEEFGLSNNGSNSGFVTATMHRLEGLGGKIWSEVPYDLLRKVCRHTHVGHPVKIRGHIRSMSYVAPTFVNGEHVDLLELLLADGRDEVIMAFPLSDPEMLTKVLALFSEYQALDFWGTVVPALIGHGGGKQVIYKFFLLDIVPSDNPLQMIQATSSEIAVARALVDSLSGKPDGILDFIRGSLVEIVGIKGLDEAPELEQCIRFMILAALSDGYEARRSLSHKLHSLVIGSPAVGKKLLCKIAEILNPAYKYAEPHRVTVPGVVGRASQKNGSWTSHPGLIPLAHRGTFAIEDFHHVDPQRKRELLGVFSPVMENGRLFNATAAKMGHQRRRSYLFWGVLWQKH